MAYHDVEYVGKNPALPALSQGIYTSDRAGQQKPVSKTCGQIPSQCVLCTGCGCVLYLTNFGVLSSVFPRFFAALLTAVLTYHLAWVPTVMPVDHPPIKAFSEKRTSQSVNMLAKTHPYNPLWAQLG